LATLAVSKLIFPDSVKSLSTRSSYCPVVRLRCRDCSQLAHLLCVHHAKTGSQTSAWNSCSC